MQKITKSDAIFTTHDDIFPRLQRETGLLSNIQRDAARLSAALASFAASPQLEDQLSPVTAKRIRAYIQSRRERNDFFGTELFADPAWDMLLDLSAARLEGRQVSVSSLCIAAAVPTTTALRWIRLLIERGILLREPDPTDGRRAYVSLSETAAVAMDRCQERAL